jgi:hypothetical protein
MPNDAEKPNDAEIRDPGAESAARVRVLAVRSVPTPFPRELKSEDRVMRTSDLGER